jgi:hypothetical protein
MALTALTKDFLARSGLSVEGTNIVTTATYTSGLQTGTFQVAGGGAIGKNLIVGSTATVYGATNLLSTLNVTGSSVLANLTATVFTATSSNILGNETVGGNVVITSNNAATGASNASGSLQVTGGAGIGGALYVGGNTYIGGDLYVDGTQFVVNKQSISSGDATLTLSTGSANASLAANAGLQIGSTSSPYITWLYDGVANWVSSGGVKVSSSTLATSTATGALQVAGGVGIGGNLIVGAAVTATNFYGYLGGANGTANLYGGATGSLVYQSAANTTAFLPAGTNGYVLEMVSGLPSWAPISGLSAGNANTATNIGGGLANQIPYQSAPGSTTFSSNLVFNGTTFTTTNVTITSTNQGTSYSSGNALQVAGGVGIAGALYVNNASYINGAQIITTATINTYANQTTITAGTDTAVSTSTGNITIWDTSTLQSVTNRGASTNNAISITNTLSNTSTTSSNALYVAGGLGVGNGANINGNSYITGNLVVSGTITGTNVTVNNITGTSGVFYGDSTGNAALYAGIVGGTVFAQTIIQATGNYNGYMEINAQNINTGAKNSTDIVASANNVGINNSFIDMGITGSAWDGSQAYSLGTALGANDGYLLVGPGATPGQGNLVLATTTAGTNIRFLVQATNAQNSSTTVTNASTAILINPVNTQATSTSTGTLVVYGGAGIASNIYVGGNSFVAGTSTSTSQVITGTASVSSTNTGALQVAGGVGIGGGLYVGGAITATSITISSSGTDGGTFAINGATSATSTSTGALTVAGGVGVGGALYASQLFDNSNRVVTAVTASAGTGISITGATTTGPSASFTVNNTGVTSAVGSTYIGVSTATGAVTFTNLGVQTLTAGTDTAVSSTTGTVTVWDISTLQSVTGRGAATTNAITINNATAATSTITGALIITNGGIGLGGSVYAGGSVTAGTGLYSIGTYGGTYTDGIVVDYATGNGRVSVGSNDNITFYAGGLAATQTVQISSTGTVTIAGTAASVSTTTGALQVAGGVGVAGNVYASGTVTAGGPAVSGTSVNAFVSNNFELASYTSAAITTTGGTTLLDTYAIATYRTAEYLVQLWDSSTNSIHSEKIMVTTDGTNVFITEYAVVTNNGELGTFDAGLSTGIVTLKFVASSASNLVIKVVRTSITA